MRALLLLVLYVATAVAQGGGGISGVPLGPPDPLARVREYLGLTDVQSTAILRNNNEYNSFVRDKQLRISQVQQEIAQLTVAEPLDPLGLGTRYAEIESICRQLRDKANEIYRRNLTVLTDAQKTKLSGLNEALKLLAVYSEAQYAALVGPYTNAPATLNSFGSYTGYGIATGAIFSPPFYGCQQPSLPTLSIRNGDFSGLIPAPAPQP
jgi:hypothetical protein